MTKTDTITHNFINVVEKEAHNGRLTLDDINSHTEGYSKPALFRGLASIDPAFATREFYEQVDSSKLLQWRVKDANKAVSMRSTAGGSDYNFVTGKVGSGAEFLNDVFVRKLDVYSHLGTISSGYSDPYEWGKLAFKHLQAGILSKDWFRVDGWELSGHMFFGYSTQQYGEPRNGAVGSDWHMFPTLNMFVMVAGKKKWSTRPPELGEQFREYDKLFSTSSGREAPGLDFESDVIYLEPGDVLVNPPFEWHKVLNAEGISIGAAFRVIDTSYLSQLGSRESLDLSRVDIKADPANKEELAHFLTSVNYASRHLNRAQMLLNDMEYAYLRKKGERQEVHIGHL